MRRKKMKLVKLYPEDLKASLKPQKTIVINPVHAYVDPRRKSTAMEAVIENS